jgi:hypothetical protein
MRETDHPIDANIKRYGVGHLFKRRGPLGQNTTQPTSHGVRSQHITPELLSFSLVLAVRILSRCPIIITAWTEYFFSNRPQRGGHDHRLFKTSNIAPVVESAPLSRRLPLLGRKISEHTSVQKKARHETKPQSFQVRVCSSSSRTYFLWLWALWTSVTLTTTAVLPILPVHPSGRRCEIIVVVVVVGCSWLDRSKNAATPSIAAGANVTIYQSLAAPSANGNGHHPSPGLASHNGSFDF